MFHLLLWTKIIFRKSPERGREPVSGIPASLQDTMFGQWKDESDYKKYVELARKIANLEERKERNV